MPDGYCASVFADDLGVVRHIAVAQNGDVFIAVNDAPDSTAVGGLWALRDEDNDGVAEQVEEVFQGGGSGVAVDDSAVYFATQDTIYRFAFAGTALVPDEPIVVVTGLPADGDHRAKSIVVDGDDLVVNIGSGSNSCQEENRVLESPGIDPCAELDVRAGLWRFSASDVGQVQADGERIVTGLRNGNALTVWPATGDLVTIQNGRDQLFENWPDLYTADDDERLPAEALYVITEGANYGWPYCYFDPELDANVLAPEYGGDGTAVGLCDSVPEPDAVFPAHWAPLSLLPVDASFGLGAGFLVAFHGARFPATVVGDAPGYSVGFIAVDAQNNFAETFSTFAGGFAASTGALPETAAHRPMGLAQGPDGSVFITDDKAGRIWRVIAEE